jgi:hypothetical protein
MLLRRFFILSVISVLALTGCPPKKNAKEKIRTGRTNGSPTGGKNANGLTNSYNSNNPQTTWGQVQVQSNDSYTMRLFSAPYLASLPETEQLGQVNAIYFWGNVVMGLNGTIDSARSRIHLEVFDNKYGTPRGDGTLYEQLFVHIGSEQEGFQGVQGNMQTGITFAASYMSIMLVPNGGQVNGGTFSGTVYFYNGYVEQWMPLGQFSVQSNGFFTNY